MSTENKTSAWRRRRRAQNAEALSTIQSGGAEALAEAFSSLTLRERLSDGPSEPASVAQADLTETGKPELRSHLCA